MGPYASVATIRSKETEKAGFASAFKIASSAVIIVSKEKSKKELCLWVTDRPWSSQGQGWPLRPVPARADLLPCF